MSAVAHHTVDNPAAIAAQKHFWRNWYSHTVSCDGRKAVAAFYSEHSATPGALWAEFDSVYVNGDFSAIAGRLEALEAEVAFIGSCTLASSTEKVETIVSAMASVKATADAMRARLITLRS